MWQLIITCLAAVAVPGSGAPLTLAFDRCPYRGAFDGAADCVDRVRHYSLQCYGVRLLLGNLATDGMGQERVEGGFQLACYLTVPHPLRW